MGAAGSWFASATIFLVAAVLTMPALLSLRLVGTQHGRAPAVSPGRDDAEDGEADVARREGSVPGPRLLVFAACVVLFFAASAALLPAVAGQVTRRRPEFATLIVAATILLPQVIVALIAPWIGRTAERAGRRPMLLLGWGLLPVQGLLYAVWPAPYSVMAGQILNGTSSAVFGVMMTLVAADLTRGKGQFNLMLGTLGVAISIGASLSTFLTGIIASTLGASAAYGGLTLTGLAGLLLLWLRMPETRHPCDQGARACLRKMNITRCGISRLAVMRATASCTRSVSSYSGVWARASASQRDVKRVAILPGTGLQSLNAYHSPLTRPATSCAVFTNHVGSDRTVGDKVTIERHKERNANGPSRTSWPAAWNSGGPDEHRIKRGTSLCPVPSARLPAAPWLSCTAAVLPAAALVLLSVQAGGRLAALQEGPRREPPSAQSAAMRGRVRRLVPLWVALPVPPVGVPNVQLANATDFSIEDFMKGAWMRLIWTTTCAMALSISLSAAQTPSASGGSNAATPPPATATASDPIAPAGRWNVAQAGCRAILSELDETGRRSGCLLWVPRGQAEFERHRHVTDQGDLRHVFETCRGHPDMTIVAAFRTLRQNSHSR